MSARQFVPAESEALTHSRCTRKPTVQTDMAAASLHRVLASPGKLLDPTPHQDKEQRFSRDFSRIRVHPGAVAEVSVQKLNANTRALENNGGRPPLAQHAEFAFAHIPIAPPRVLQAKLSINQPRDRYELEADHMEAQLTGTPPPLSLRSLRAEPTTTVENDQTARQRRQLDPRSTRVATTFHHVTSEPHSLLRHGTPLSTSVRALMEPSFGYDFSTVRVHTGLQEASSAQALNALAYTIGTHIVFNSGQYTPDTDNGRRLLAHELTHVVQQSSNASLPQLQRKVILKGATMSAKQREAFIHAKKWTNASLARAVIDDMADATDPFDFSDEHELESEVLKRVSTAEHMKESQAPVGPIPGDKQPAFGYPFSTPSGLYGPRVNYAARDYWEPSVPDAYAIRTDKKKNKELLGLPRHERCKVYGDQCGGYSWALSAKGKADPYEAIARLFVAQPPHKRTLIHCDYLVSLVHFRSFADSIGAVEFNKRVKAYGVNKISLRWNAFQDLQAEFYETVRVGGMDVLAKRKGLGSVQRVAPSSEADFIIGDHVIFFNHLAYDPLNKNVGNAWRLENAVLIGKGDKGADVFLGHGSGRKTSAQLRAKLAEEFNDVAKDALGQVEKTKSKDLKARTQALANLSKKFPNVTPVGSEWHIRGKAGLCTTKTVDEKLRTIKGAEVIGPKDPCDPAKMYPVERPIESAK